MKTVVFHYDEHAPVKSRKLSNSKKEESRFDIYTEHRVYKLKTEGNSVWESEAWVKTLREAAETFNPNFGDV